MSVAAVALITAGGREVHAQADLLACSLRPSLIICSLCSALTAPAVTPCRDCYQEPPSRRERERSNPAQKGPSPSNRSMPSTLPQPARSSRTSLAATHPSSGSHHHMQASQPAYASQASIRHWVHAVETGCPTGTFSASSSNIINASANANTRQSAMKMRSPSSGSSKCITSQSTRLSDTSAYPNPVPPPLASYSSLSDVDGARDINTNWFAMPNHASHRNIPPLPSTPSSAQRPAMPAFSSYQIPRKLAFPIDYVDNATWTKQSWRDESSLNAVDDEPMPMDEDTIQDAYPRPSSRLSEIHLTSLATAFARSEFSPLMHQTFTFALTGNDTEGSDSGQPDMNATRFYPAALPLDELDLTSQWSPPALRSASSTSSLDPFSMDLFSPTTEFPDAASVWDDSYRSIDESSISPDDYSSSPFIGWSSASDKGDPKAVLPMLTMGYTTATQPLTTIPLHQPQPIRPIPPIPVDLLDEAIANDDYIADG